MKKTMNQLGCAAAAALVLGIGGVAVGQEQSPPPEPAKAQEPKAPPAGEPTLDDLLGIKPTEGAKAPDAGKDAAKAELDRQLSAAEMDDEFEQAVKLMGETAKRLGEARDAGLDTQRMQEQTLTKLDKLIDMAKSQKQKKSKSKKKQDQQQDQQQQDQQNKQSSQQNQQGQQEQQQQAGGNAQGGVVAGQSGKLNAPPGAGAAWGQLPERLREALMQGTNDYTSDKWKALTREYYKRLAEQPGGPK